MMWLMLEPEAGDDIHGVAQEVMGAWGMSFEELSEADPADVEAMIDREMAARWETPEEAAMWDAVPKRLDRAIQVAALIVWIITSILLLRGL